EHDDFDSEEGATIEALWIFEVPMALPLDARLPDAQLQRAREALRRAKAVGEEYEGVEVATATVRARRAGQAIVDDARRRGEDAGGLFTVGHAIEADALEEAGIERADIFIASTDGDNTNLTISQIAKRGYGVERVVARIMDPYRAAWYAEQGLETICPTKIAI